MMIPEIGIFALVLALTVAIFQSALPLLGAHRGIINWMNLARPASWAQLTCLAVAFACLTLAFISHDFSVAYVAANSNRSLPLMYRISAVWGGHEGSLLLWAFILALWSAGVACFSGNTPSVIVARVLGVMGLVSIGFLLFLLLTSNPFERLLPPPADGASLNPLLQDPGLAIHPPMLYMGYVGFAVAFAFAIAALLGRQLDSAWVRWTRPWTNWAWAFLTVGITLGSWWAYNELGWGGWWFWDPVENASFMPWLAGTALIHSLAATEKRGVYKSWTVLLAILTFSLSLLGTFLVRSGVLTSVHAFATDPERGVFILIFLALVVGGSLVLFAARASSLTNASEFSAVSRETGLLFNNVLLTVALATVLLGTLYPLFVDAFALGKVSVGPPYFNTVLLPVMAPLALALGLGAIARWRADNLGRLLGNLRWAVFASLAGGPLWVMFGDADFTVSAALGVTLGLWVTFATAQGLYDRYRGRSRIGAAIGSTPRAVFGMTLAHFGVGIFIIGLTLTQAWSIEKDVNLAPGERFTIGKYTFFFHGTSEIEGPNYVAQRAQVDVTAAERVVAKLKPEKRIYQSKSNPMTEAATHIGLTHDLYVSLGEPSDALGAWNLRLQIKAFVRWIWAGALLMACGGGIAACDRRYFASRRRQPISIGASAAAGGD